MKKLVGIVVGMMVAGAAWAHGPVRIDLAALAAADGPSKPGFSVGADVPFGGDWAYSLRASRVAEDEASATSLTAGLEYALAYGKIVPYLGGRVGARWEEDEVEVCVPRHKKTPLCNDVEVEEDGLLYQATVGVDFKSKGMFGATVEAAYNGGEGEGVEFLVGVTIRP